MVEQSREENARRSTASGPYHRGVHGLAVLLTMIVFPLIWVGSLVTTYDAGMAVPDWPATYGWNMFAYPISTWLYGPFDLMVEHSHRLLASLAGFLSIALVAAAWLGEPRRWFRWWTIGILAAVIAQGVLGGARVVLDQRTMAMIHGCVGPLFFALATATAVMSSRWWREKPWLLAGGPAEAGSAADAVTSSSRVGSGVGGWTCWIATAAALCGYLQLILGAQLRHATAAISHSRFLGFVHLHLTMAGIVLMLTIVLAGVTTINRRAPGRVRRPALLLCLLVLAQVGLGIGTWVVNYALPWAETHAKLAAYTILAKGYWESLIISAHVATGSLIIAVACVAMLRAWRLRRSVAR